MEHHELIAAEWDVQAVTVGKGKVPCLATQDIVGIFGDDIEAQPTPTQNPGTAKDPSQESQVREKENHR